MPTQLSHWFVSTPRKTSSAQLPVLHWIVWIQLQKHQGSLMEQSPPAVPYLNSTFSIRITGLSWSALLRVHHPEIRINIYGDSAGPVTKGDQVSQHLPSTRLWMGFCAITESASVGVYSTLGTPSVYVLLGFHAWPTNNPQANLRYTLIPKRKAPICLSVSAGITIAAGITIQFLSTKSCRCAHPSLDRWGSLPVTLVSGDLANLQVGIRYWNILLDFLESPTRDVKIL